MIFLNFNDRRDNHLVDKSNLIILINGVCVILFNISKHVSLKLQMYYVKCAYTIHLDNPSRGNGKYSCVRLKLTT